MSGTRVLIVDDEVEFAATLSERLELRGYEAKAVYCAEDAIALARSNPPQVMLLDLRMPGMSGLDLIRVIKQFDSDIVIILLTGHGEEESRTEGLASGAADYIMKPVDIEKLLIKIEQAISAQGGAKA
jgi:DNA-binding response OmpR family regulator